MNIDVLRDMTPCRLRHIPEDSNLQGVGIITETSCKRARYWTHMNSTGSS
jgi:hypothetical protein